MQTDPRLEHLSDQDPAWVVIHGCQVHFGFYGNDADSVPLQLGDDDLAGDQVVGKPLGPLDKDEPDVTESGTRATSRSAWLDLVQPRQSRLHLSEGHVGIHVGGRGGVRVAKLLLYLTEVLRFS